MSAHYQVEVPNWSTKQLCNCGYESVSRCEQWKHQADERLIEVNRSLDALEVAKIYIEATDTPHHAAKLSTLDVVNHALREAEHHG